MKKFDLSTMKTAKFSPVKGKAKERTVNFRMLIVSEGTKTEKNYFEAFPKLTVQSLVVDVECEGTATNTLWVVKEAERLEEEARRKKRPYDKVWVVFDRDSFDASNFDNAISKAEQKHYGCAWSNEAFELWYVLHFEDRQTPMSRRDYEMCITRHVSKHLPSYRYRKNDPHTYDILEKYGNQHAACLRAKNMDLSLAGTPPNRCNPATTVYKLVNQLNGLDDDFNKILKAKLKGGKEDSETNKNK